jgi:hypothetical protein
MEPKTLFKPPQLEPNYKKYDFEPIKSFNC